MVSKNSVETCCRYGTFADKQGTWIRLLSGMIVFINSRKDPVSHRMYCLARVALLCSVSITLWWTILGSVMWGKNKNGYHRDIHFFFAKESLARVSFWWWHWPCAWRLLQSVSHLFLPVLPWHALSLSSKLAVYVLIYPLWCENCMSNRFADSFL